MRPQALAALATLAVATAFSPVGTPAADHGPVLDVGPEFVPLPTSEPGTSHTLHARARIGSYHSDPLEGATIVFIIETGPNTSSDPLTCTTDDEGACSVSYVGAGGEGNDMIRAGIDEDVTAPDAEEGADATATPGAAPEPDGTDVVEALWQVEPIPYLDVEPEDQHHEHRVTLTATARDGAGNPMQVNIDFDVSYQQPDVIEMECDTDATGTCAVAYPPEDTRDPSKHRLGNSPVPIPVLAWIDFNGDDVVPGESDSAEDIFEEWRPGDVAEPDQTDVVWVALGPGGCIRGTQDDDIILGSESSDCIEGRRGNDIIRGLGGSDYLGGGPEDDILRGGKGSDGLTGGRGDDRAVGGDGRDSCIAETERACEPGRG